MLLPGYRYRLKVVSIDHRGAWLDAEDEKVLLARSECPPELCPEAEIEVFIYLERGNRRCATTRFPIAQIGEFALLQCRAVGPHGAFLDWGLPKDLLVPFAEQAGKMLEGRRYLVRICHDAANRPIGSSRLEKFLELENSDLREGEEVDLLLWTFTDLGAKVIVNNRYQALLYRDDLPRGLKCGDRISGYVQRIRPDGRIDVTLRRPGLAGVRDAREVVLDALAEDGFLPLGDQSPPEQIRNRLGLSKKVFKKALGGLYKDGLIELGDLETRLREAGKKQR